MPDSPKRQQVIEHMVAIAQQDMPWVWGFHIKQFSLYHQWNYNVKPNMMANNTLKYRRIDATLRDTLRQQWNQPLLWPLAVVVLLSVLLISPAIVAYWRKKYKKTALNSTESGK